MRRAGAGFGLSLVALVLVGCDGGHLPIPSGRAAPNPTRLENQRQGSPDWEIASPAEGREIEGYASATSVNRGEAIELFVSTADPGYAIDVFRMGWYGGAGARRVAGPIARPGLRQATPPPDPTTGLVECRWREPYRLVTARRHGPWTERRLPGAADREPARVARPSSCSSCGTTTAGRPRSFSRA